MIVLCYFLSQIEVLGVSVPWDGVYHNYDPGARIAELAKKGLTESSSHLSSTHNNPFSGTSPADEHSTPPVQQSASADWLDLLTGGDEFSEAVSHPLSQNNVQEGSDFLDFLDQTVSEDHGTETFHALSSSQDRQSPDIGAEKYINCLKTLVGPQMVSYHVFTLSSQC